MGALLSLALILLLAAVGAWALWGGRAEGPATNVRLGIASTLPLRWGEADLKDIAAGRATPAPAWAWLERRYRLSDVDRIDAAALKGVDVLLLAQPRALAPRELVALDKWVRTGGRLLVLADPALAWDSRYPVGDKRRPLFTSLLSPLFSHWGVELVMPMDDTPERSLSLDGQTVETVLAGEWLEWKGRSACTIEADGFLARCNPGRGRALLVADADLLDARHWRRSGPLAAMSGERTGNMRWLARQIDALAAR